VNNDRDTEQYRLFSPMDNKGLDFNKIWLKKLVKPSTFIQIILLIYKTWLHYWYLKHLTKRVKPLKLISEWDRKQILIQAFREFLHIVQAIGWDQFVGE